MDKPNRQPDDRDERRSQMIDAASGYAAAFGFIGTILVFAALGWLLDYWLKITPWGILAGVALGFFGATYKIVRDMNRGR